MPEAAVNEDNRAPSREYQIRAPRQILTVQPEAKAECVQTAAQQQFGLRVFATYAAHVETPLRRRKHIHHGDDQAPIASATTSFSAVVISATLMPGRKVTAPKRKLRRYSG